MKRIILLAACCAPWIGGCATTIIDGTDRGVTRLIENRQRETIAIVSGSDIGEEDGQTDSEGTSYQFVPQRTPDEIPASFQTSNEPAAVENAQGDAEIVPADDALDEQAEASESIFTEEEANQVEVFALHDALSYATRHSRQYQDAKEDLYLAALDLTLERHLWTPQFVASIDAQFSDQGQEQGFDRALSSVAELAVSQRLPLGGEVTARVLGNLMRDLREHVSTGESGSVILEADIPLLRGAGRTAYETRYQTERELIYAVRTFERFRREFLVSIARQFFNLQQLKAQITNSYKAYLGRRQDWEKADFVNRMGKSRTISDLSRALASFRNSDADLVSAKERYASNLDQFKIVIGMPVDKPLDVLDQEDDKGSAAVEQLLPNVDSNTSVAVALEYRLDLLTSADRVDDSQRGVAIAKNRILPDLDLNGSVTLDSDPEHLNTFSFNTERTSWLGGVSLRMDDRKTERNAFRRSLITFRRSQRNHEQFVDSVRADVRRARRRVEQQRSLRTIQTLRVEESQVRAEAARAQFDLDRATNQEVVDAEDELLAARNRYAGAVADYRNAVLEFRRDTGTLRVNDNGLWQGFELFVPDQPPNVP